ncbi:MAG: RHS repeat-associated core domain-containing protein, partial [Chloroflexi bacterium]|nr:RHS repeat-associated core domain-containing protein [Chloroflexota bacterium]
GDLGWSRLYVGRSDVWWDNAFGAGLLYMHARTYSPSLGRFLQPDPVAAEGNLYGYAGDSPVTKSDPSGLFWYRVKKGDTLLGLSRRFWGDARACRRHRPRQPRRPRAPPQHASRRPVHLDPGLPGPRATLVPRLIVYQGIEEWLIRT